MEEILSQGLRGGMLVIRRLFSSYYQLLTLTAISVMFWCDHKEKCNLPDVSRFVT